MTELRELEVMARNIIDSNLYMTLGTADGAGRPWASPVYYAPDRYREFHWVSDPGARHSRNIAARPEVSIVIFDSSTPINAGQAVYLAAAAAELAGDDLDQGIEIFSRRSRAHGAEEWTREDVLAPADRRLYRATASEIFVLGEHDSRIPVSLG